MGKPVAAVLLVPGADSSAIWVVAVNQPIAVFVQLIVTPVFNAVALPQGGAVRVIAVGQAILIAVKPVAAAPLDEFRAQVMGGAVGVGTVGEPVLVPIEPVNAALPPFTVAAISVFASVVSAVHQAVAVVV